MTVKPLLTVGDRNVPVSRLMRHVQSAREDRLEFEPPKGSDASTMLCAGGTTGLPKIACRTHFSEAFDSWALSRFNSEALVAGTTSLCGLPLFHSNAIMVTGLLCFLVGAHVVWPVPQGIAATGSCRISGILYRITKWRLLPVCQWSIRRCRTFHARGRILARFSLPLRGRRRCRSSCSTRLSKRRRFP